jgi:CheY-like chemotaxis protein
VRRRRSDLPNIYYKSKPISASDGVVLDEFADMKPEVWYEVVRPILADGVEALAALKANGQIDLVVTNINMPRMDGLTLLQKLQKGQL